MAVFATLGGVRKPRFPVPGGDFASAVELAGLGVTEFEPDGEVYGLCHGAFAEYIAVPPPDRLAAKPSSLTIEQAAAVPLGRGRNISTAVVLSAFAGQTLMSFTAGAAAARLVEAGSPGGKVIVTVPLPSRSRHPGSRSSARSIGPAQAKALMPVRSRPTMRAWIVSVPSNVWMASMSAMCRIT